MRFDFLTMTLGVLLCGSMACMDPQEMCDNDPVSSVVSPDDQWHAVLFYHNCGALATQEVGVSVLRVGQDLAEGDQGNVLRYLNTARAPQSIEPYSKYPLPELEWKSATQLNVRYDRRLEVRTKRDTIGPVRIWYVRYDRS